MVTVSTATASKIVSFAEHGSSIRSETNKSARAIATIALWILVSLFAFSLYLAIAVWANATSPAWSKQDTLCFVALMSFCAAVAGPVQIAGASTLLIDAEKRTYQLSYGVFPFYFKRSGALTDFKHVVVGKSELNVWLGWRGVQLPFLMLGNTILLAGFENPSQAMEFGQQIAGKLGLPLYGLER